MIHDYSHNDPKLRHFEDAYIGVRTKEQRVLTLDEIKSLPYGDESRPNGKEWKLREQSFERFKEYIVAKAPTSLLDIACGNGWLLYQLQAYIPTLAGIEINKTELDQAEAILNDSVNLYYGSLFDIPLKEKYDIITLAAGIQYFSSIEPLIERLQSWLSPRGEIHIFDSPFYQTEDQQQAAKRRSTEYFQSHKEENMLPYYHHHKMADLSAYNSEVLYNPRSLVNKIKGKVKPINPFPWIKING